MTEQPTIGYEYDEIGDVLDIYFGDNRRAWTVELTDNILISIDRQTEKAVSLTLLDLTELVRPTSVGPRSFPLTGLDAFPPAERDLVIRVLTTPPVSDLLDVSSVLSLPTSPLPIMHLEPHPIEALGPLTMVASRA